MFVRSKSKPELTSGEKSSLVDSKLKLEVFSVGWSSSLLVSVSDDAFLPTNISKIDRFRHQRWSFVGFTSLMLSWQFFHLLMFWLLWCQFRSWWLSLLAEQGSLLLQRSCFVRTWINFHLKQLFGLVSHIHTSWDSRIGTQFEAQKFWRVEMWLSFLAWVTA